MSLSLQFQRSVLDVRLVLIAQWIFVAVCLPRLVLAQADSPDFLTQVQPIFQSHCIQCHGPESQESGYRLDVREIALKGGDSGDHSIVPGSTKTSRLLALVRGDEPHRLMPPKESGVASLTESEIQVISDWIDTGAEWPATATTNLPDPLDWWSLKPLKRPELPSKSQHPIDAFISAKLQEHGLSMSKEADARTLCRRLYFDLIGLPPSPEEVDAFEIATSTNSQKAYAELVDRLLASDRYGEKWARHWLDVVHYGDTHGYDKDKPRPNAWPYRDYVIRSLNKDKPYAQFLQEQIAGDALYPNTRDGIEALGFLSAGPWDFIGHAEVSETKTDGKIARHMDRDDMLGNAIGTLCSSTIQCAQCHNHKFDPFSQEDYYSLQAVFAALDRADKYYDTDPTVAKQRLELTEQKRELSVQLEVLEASIQEQCSPELPLLDSKIASIEKASQNPRPVEYGWHSEIASNEYQSKWVQVDLGEIHLLETVVVQPTWDDFNGIGAGFGFPKRFRVEVSNDPTFTTNVSVVVSKEQSDFENPGIASLRFQCKGLSGRYIRMTATKLAPRLNDFIFAIAELKALSASGENLAKSKSVEAFDSIEAPSRWSKNNLTDDLFPENSHADELAQLKEQRIGLIKDRVRGSTLLEKQKTEEQQLELERRLKSLPAQSVTYAGTVHTGTGNFVGTGGQGGKPRAIHLLARGQVTRPIREVSAGTINIGPQLPNRFSIRAEDPESQRRIALSEWIVSHDNPLTWRSIVNRVWQYHFGIGIVATSNDFGRMGELPSHPELLDWLAAEFRDQGGSLKSLHRLIVTSSAYRQTSSASLEDANQKDPSNRLLWRQHRRKLDAEAIRDSILSVSGTLDFEMGGPGWQDFVVTSPDHSPHYEYRLADPNDKKTWRRSIYRFIVRSQTQPFLTVLNCADPSMRVERRVENDSPQQALALLNNRFVLTQARQFAARVQNEVGDSVTTQVDRAFQLATGHLPSDSNRKQMVEFAKEHGMDNLCRLVLNLNEFVFVD